MPGAEPDGTVNFRLANVGKLRTEGIEVDSAARVTDDLRISLSAAYLDAKHGVAGQEQHRPEARKSNDRCFHPDAETVD